jgi:hypothetical protein
MGILVLLHNSWSQCEEVDEQTVPIEAQFAQGEHK